MSRRLALIVVPALVAALLPMAGAAAAPQKPHPVQVPANAEPWVDTGITLTGGETVTITARGQAITGPLSVFPGARSGPDGQATICPDPGGPAVGCALDGAPYGALVGRIGGGSPFLVGSSYTATPGTGGVLELAVNDNLGFSFDNHGAFNVFVNR